MIRNWKEKDNEEIAELEKICFSYPWSYESIRETFALCNFVGVVAENADFVCADNQLCNDNKNDGINGGKNDKKSDEKSDKKSDENSGGIAGYAGAIFACDEADIALVAVKPENRRKGIARAMLKKLFEELIARGINKIYLEVRISNTNARSLYDSLGFLPVGIRKNYYENAEDAIVMVKDFMIEK